MPLIDRLSGLELFMDCSVGSKYANNALAVRAPPRTPLSHWGSSQRSLVPDLLVGWGGGYQSQSPAPIGASILVPPVEAWCPR